MALRKARSKRAPRRRGRKKRRQWTANPAVLNNMEEPSADEEAIVQTSRNCFSI
jgi:hypothetical protein